LHPLGWERPAGNLEYRVTQGFDSVNPDYPTVKHRALDLGNTRLGGPVTAPASGVVIAEGYLREPWSTSTARFGTGNFGGIMVVIRHDDHYTSALAHLRESIVNAGQPVLAHQLVGYLGDTGSAQGQGHLHWDLYRDGTKVDAWPLLEQNFTLPDTSTGGTPDMRYAGSEVAFTEDAPLYRLTVGAKFRPAPSTQNTELAIFPQGTGVRGFPFTVKGEALASGDRWLPALMYTGTAYESGYFHTSVIELVPVPNDAAALQAALDSANQRTATVKNIAVAGIKSTAAGMEALADKIAKL
jgi:murein DD-endopeptidase MepM/ murein hydrolase activator NlpD